MTARKLVRYGSIATNTEQAAMPKSPEELGKRILDDVSSAGPSDWISTRKEGELSVQAWAERWNGAKVQLQISHDKIHAVDIDGAVLDQASTGMLGLPSGLYLRAVVTGAPDKLTVSVAPAGV
jgi:hypothetical protein